MKNQALLLICFLFLIPAGVSAQNKDLDYYIQKAKTNSPLLYELGNKVKITELDSLKTRATYNPMVSAVSNVIFSPTYKGFGYDTAISNGQNVEALLTVSKQLISQQNLKKRLDNYKLDKKSIENQARLSTDIVEKTVTEQYITTFLNQQLLHLSNEIISFLQNEDKILRKLAKNSNIKQTDYLNFKVTLQQTLFNNEQQRSLWMNNLSTLNYLSGIDNGGMDSIITPAINLPAVVSYEESFYGRNNAIDSLKNKNNEQLINLNYKPQISVFANGGYSSSFMTSPYKNLGVSMGVSINLPLYDGKQKKMSLMQNELNDQNRKRYRDADKQHYTLQKQELLRQIERCDKLTSMTPEQFKYTKALVDANALLLGTGEVSMTDFLLSITNYMNIRTIDIQNRANKQLLINQLNHLILP
ncbi:TolC family protein [uncultured Bacteroides sp.]|uniref:TolC family protein n=1 Tax=uncultured Bacteroides sp. TaxID=162156 RepID=UPI002AA7A8E0|nr:TolC family protein [uncultured Bacteroides sp.]